MKRFFDIIFSSIMIILLSPIFLGISIWIATDSRGGIIYRQKRVGKEGKEFFILKFRTMKPDNGQQLQITVGSRDSRITRAGYWLRRFKMDELPQLVNVFLGEMSVVGPRPEVPKYVALYNDQQRAVLSVRPGITDMASLQYFEESDLIAQSDQPEKTYIEVIMPEKLRINLHYIQRASFLTDLEIIGKTVLRIFGIG